jgi:hypothetical protein
MYITPVPKEPPPAPPEPDRSTLGGKVWHTLREALSEGFRLATYPIATAIQWGAELILRLMRREAVQMVRPILTDIKNAPDTPTELRSMIDYLLSQEGELADFILSGVGGNLMSGVVGGVIPALTSPITAWAWRKTQGMRLDPQTVITAKWRGHLQTINPREEMASSGYSDVRQDIIEKLMRPWFDPNTAIQLWLREIWKEDKLNDHLKSTGFWDVDADALKRLAWNIPGASDLISMAVREAWDDDFAAKWGTDLLFPSEFAKWMKKQGYSEEWAKRYWRAHWTLPSVEMGFEMFHRGELKETELRQLLKAQDIMPGYQDKLINIAYTPYTRVDVRRMYGMGILDPDQVKKAYMDLGYDEERAENLKKFTVLYETEGNRELAKSDILDGYKKQMVGHDKALAMLMDMGYPEEDASFLLARVDYQVAQQVKDETLSAIKANYVEGVWDLTQTIAALGKLALPSKEEDRLLELWGIERERRIQRPGVSKLEEFYISSTITEANFRAELQTQGYSPTYIEWYVNNLEAKKRETLERKSAEEQRKALAQIKSPSKAELAVWWTKGFITEQDMRSRMLKLGYQEGDIDNYIKTIEAEIAEENARMAEDELRRKQAQIAHPTKADLKAFYQRGIITEDEFRAELAAQGFEAKWIDRYILSAQAPTPETGE